MIKFISIAAVAVIASIFCLSCTYNKSVVENTAKKIISMAVFTSSNYAAKVYQGSTAGLSIAVKKEQKGRDVVVMEKSFPSIPLQYFPDAVNAFKDSFQIAGIKNEEILEISYTLTYNSHGSIMQTQGDEMITGLQKGTSLNINI